MAPYRGSVSKIWIQILILKSIVFCPWLYQKVSSLLFFKLSPIVRHCAGHLPSAFSAFPTLSTCLCAPGGRPMWTASLGQGNFGLAGSVCCSAEDHRSCERSFPSSCSLCVLVTSPCPGPSWSGAPGCD